MLRQLRTEAPLARARAIASRGLHRRAASLGLDYGTESVRAVLLDCVDGRELGVGSHAYAHGQITEALPPPPADGGGAPPTALPPSFALQHPLDWIRGAEAAVAQLDLPAHAAAGTRVVGVGVDFTSCTVLPVVQRRRAGGGSSFGPSGAGAGGAGDAAVGGGAAAAAAAFDLVPLCLLPRFASRPHAWPKLWKHHGAASQAAELSAAAAADSANASGAGATGGGDWLQRRYGGVIGLEWLFPKLLEVFDGDREVFGAATHFVEAGDWVVHALLHGGAVTGAAAGGGVAPIIVRSACNAGYKACWGPQGGGGGSGCSSSGSGSGGYLLSPALLEGVRPGFSAVLGKLEGDVVAPGLAAGSTCAAPGAAATATAAAADATAGDSAAATPAAAVGLDIGLAPGTVVSASTIDAHAGVVGVGVGGTGTLVCVLGTSACYLVNGNPGFPSPAAVQGVAGAVEDGIVPGLVGYETGQSAVGDAFAWLQRFCGWEWGALEAAAAALPPGADGVACVDHFNGCRTPLMDPARRGSLHGLALSSTPAHVYRALAEASAFGCRWIVQLLEEGGVDCGRLVVTGGLAHHPFLMQVLADVLQRDLWIHPTTQGPATGAAIYGAAAAASHSADTAALLGFGDVGSAVEAMAGPASGEDAMVHVRPEPSHAAVYDELFAQYLELVRVADSSQQPGALASGASACGSDVHVGH
jgi:L-ribulokinase